MPSVCLPCACCDGAIRAPDNTIHNLHSWQALHAPILSHRQTSLLRAHAARLVLPIFASVPRHFMCPPFHSRACHPCCMRICHTRLWPCSHPCLFQSKPSGHAAAARAAPLTDTLPPCCPMRRPTHAWPCSPLRLFPLQTSLQAAADAQTQPPLRIQAARSSCPTCRAPAATAAHTACPPGTPQACPCCP